MKAELFLALSLALAALIGAVVARRIGGGHGQRFFMFVLVFAAQPAILAMSLSLGAALTMPGWLVGQLLFALAFVALPWTRGAPPPSSVSPVVREPWTGWHLTMTVLVCLLLALSLLRTFKTPVQGDASNYHASRALYWMQHSSIAPFDSHNDRQTVFGIQAELELLWGFLLTRREWGGKLVHWLALPGAACAVYCVARQLRIRRTLVLGLVLLFVSAPLVRSQTALLKSETWTTLYCLGFVYWLLAAVDDETSRRRGSLFLAGAALAFAINAKFLAVLLLPLTALAALRGSAKEAWRNGAFAVAGFATGAIASGLLFVAGSNLARFGHPFGPPGLRAVVAADAGWRTARTHLARFAIESLEVPWLPTAETRSVTENLLQSLDDAIGAGDSLVGEESGKWPGRFSISASEFAQRYSSGGLLLFVGVTVAPLLLLAKRQFGVEGPTRIEVAIVVLSCSVMGFGILLGVRWMQSSLVPGRFLVPAFALALLAVGAFVRRSIAGRRCAAVILFLAIAAAIPALTDEFSEAFYELPVGPYSGSLDEAVELVPPEARVILVVGQAVHDYPLFGFDGGLERVLSSWGHEAFDATRLRSMMSRVGATHLLFENDSEIDFHWRPPLNVGAMVEWAEGQADIVELQPSVRPVRVFAIRHEGQFLAWPRPRDARSTVPESSPLVAIDDELREELALRESWLRTPYPVERWPSSGKSFVWLGSPAEHALRFRFWSASAGALEIRLEAIAGPSRTGLERRLSIRVQGHPPQVTRFTDKEVIRVRLPTEAGVNTVEVACLDEPNVAMLANGDRRRLLAGVARLVLSRGAAESVSAGEAFR